MLIARDPVDRPREVVREVQRAVRAGRDVHGSPDDVAAEFEPVAKSRWVMPPSVFHCNATSE